MATSPIRVGLVGYGYWGRNLARCLDATPGLRLDRIADVEPNMVFGVERSYWPDLVYGSPDIDAVVIATPPATHHDLAVRALHAGQHVLVAKPLATSVHDAEGIAEAARAAGRVLMVDHTFAYTGAVRKARELLGEIGDPLYFDSVRINLGTFQKDVDVVWDLLPHDLTILAALAPGRVTGVKAEAMDPLGYGKATGAHVTLSLATGATAHCHVNWISPVKVRRVLLAGSRKMLVYDDVEPTEKLKVYDCGVVDAAEARVGYRTGDVRIPALEPGEALLRVCGEFRDAINEGREPLTGAVEGVECVGVLEAVSVALEETR